jgi:hypothetical protein
MSFCFEGLSSSGRLGNQLLQYSIIIALCKIHKCNFTLSEKWIGKNYFCIDNNINNIAQTTDDAKKPVVDTSSKKLEEDDAKKADEEKNDNILYVDKISLDLFQMRTIKTPKEYNDIILIRGDCPKYYRKKMIYYNSYDLFNKKIDIINKNIYHIAFIDIKYLEPYKDTICKQLSFNKNINEICNKILIDHKLDTKLDTKLICIHIRKDDFTTIPDYNFYTNVDWYIKELDKLNTSNYIIYLCGLYSDSDLQKFIKYNPKTLKDINLKELNKYENMKGEIIDHYIMRKADILIFGNSSFPLSAAMLSINKNAKFIKITKGISRYINPWESFSYDFEQLTLFNLIKQICSHPIVFLNIFINIIKRILSGKRLFDTY